VARLRTALATSAGGVVVSADLDRPSLVVGMRRRGRDAVTWTLPKGTPDPGETLEETALREVAEETGLEVSIREPLRAIEYAFVQDGTRIRKTVHYYLMDPIGGDLARHDAEFERVRWVPFDEAPGLLSFATERELVADVAARLSQAREAAGAPS
jgi:8-oxo-dGTP pyrophosphatase MutT (NUDIX family)